MRDGWKKTTLGDIAEYINGYPFKPSDLGGEGTAVIRIKQLLDPMEKVDRTTVDVPERCVLSNGDIVFSWSGTLAVRVWNRGTALLNQHLFRVVEKSGVSHEWLPLVIDHAIDDLVEKSHGTTMKHITKQTLLPHQVFLPPVVEQKRIVDVVASVDAYLDMLQHQVKSACVARSAVLHELISAGGNDWTETTVNKISENLSSRRIPITKSDRKSGDIPYYGASGIVDYVDGFIFDERTLLVSEDGANLIARSTPIAFSAFGKYWVNNHAHVLRFKEFATQQFVEFYLNKIRIDEWVTGAAQPKLNQKSLNEIPILLPPIDEQKRIVEIVSAMDDVIQSTEQAAVDAKALRSALLSDLLSGNHEIPASYDSLLGAA